MKSSVRIPLGSMVFAAFLCLASLVSATAAPTRLACVGDSITYGSGIHNRNHDSYPAQLAAMLGPDWQVRNFGVSGATLLKRGDRPYFKQAAYTNALDFKPDVVVIMLGTNDSKHKGPGSLEQEHAINNWQYKADYVPDYEDLISQFRKANPDVKIYVCLPTPCFPGRWGINGKTIKEEIIPMVRRVAKETDAMIIDLDKALAGKGDLFPDTVHPNATGARLMAAAVFEALTGKPSPVSALSLKKR